MSLRINLALLKNLFLKHQRSELEEVLFSYKKIFFWLFLFSAVVNFIYIVPALYMFQIYDSVLTTRSQETLLMLTLIALFFYLVNAFISWARSKVLVMVSEDMDEKLNPRVFQAAFQAVIQTGSTSSFQALSDLTNIRQFLTGTPIFAFLDTPWAFIYIIIIFLIHPYLGLFSVGSGLITLILAVYSEKVSRRDLQEANKYFQQAQNFMAGSLRNAEVVSAMGMERNIYRKWREKYLQMLELQTEASSRAGKIDALVKFVRISAQSLILGLGALLAIENKITPGLMIMGSILMGRALSPIDVVIASWRQFVSARQSYQRLKELLVSNPAPPERLPLPIPKGKVTVENLFVVPPGAKKEVLKGLSFEVHPGEITVIIGPTASGKSTLAKTLVGVWSPSIGAVKLDNADLRLYKKEHLGQYIGYLPQDIELFSGTIAENIARFGEINMELVVKAAMIAGIHEMILSFPEGYETEIGEGGSFLSGGQKQRIALARALYGDPVLIVLDEPNSNLDEEGERALMQALLFMKKQGKTIFVISHKLNILNLADNILVLHNGQMRAFGPKELVLSKLMGQPLPREHQQ